MIWLVLVIVILAVLLVLSLMWGFKRGKKTAQIKKNVEVLVDHQNTDAEVKKIQNVVKKKIIEAKNEKESDAVINHIFNIANNSKL